MKSQTKLVPVKENSVIIQDIIQKNKKAIIQMLVDNRLLSTEDEQTLRAHLPKWIPEEENIATSMEQTAYQYTILIEQILQKDYGWSEKEIIGLEQKLKKILPVLHEMEIERDLSILSPKDMEIIGDIAEKRYDRLDKVDKHFFLSAKRKQNLQLKEGKK